MAKSLILLTIFLVPLLTPAFGLGYEQIKVFAFLVLVSLITILWLKDQSKQPKLYKFSYSKIKIASIIFILILLLTSILGADPLNSIIGRPPYYQGFILYVYMLLFSFLISAYKLSLEDLSKVLTASSLFVAVVALKDLVSFKLLNQSVPLYSERVVSTLGQPNFYAGFLLISLPFIYFLAFNHKYTPGMAKLNLVDTPGVSKDGEWKILAGISLLLSIAAIGISGSRSSIVLTFATVLIILFGYIKYKLKIIVILIVVLILAGSVYFSFSRSTGIIFKEYLQPAQSDQWLFHNSPEKRLFIWPVIFELIQKKPVLGYGLSGLEDAWTEYFQKFKPELGQMSALNFTLKDLYINSSHNYLLDLLIFSGVLGLLGWLSLVGTAMKFLFPPNPIRHTLLAALLMYLLFIQFQNQSIVHLLFFWSLIGFIDKPGKKVNDTAHGRQQKI